MRLLARFMTMVETINQDRHSRRNATSWFFFLLCHRGSRGLSPTAGFVQWIRYFYRGSLRMSMSGRWNDRGIDVAFIISVEKHTTVFLLLREKNWSTMMKNKITRTGNDTHSERRGFWVDDLAAAAAFAIRRVCTTMLILATEQAGRNNVRL